MTEFYRPPVEPTTLTIICWVVVAFMVGFLYLGPVVA